MEIEQTPATNETENESMRKNSMELINSIHDKLRISISKSQMMEKMDQTNSVESGTAIAPGYGKRKRMLDAMRRTFGECNETRRDAKNISADPERVEIRRKIRNTPVPNILDYMTTSGTYNSSSNSTKMNNNKKKRKCVLVVVELDTNFLVDN